MQCLEEIARLLEREWFREGAFIQRFEGRFARISVPAGNATESCVTQFRRCLYRAVDDRSSYLQCAQIALGKSVARKINRGNGKLLLIEPPQVICKQADFFQLCGSRGNGFANIGKCREFGFGSSRRCGPLCGTLAANCRRANRFKTNRRGAD